MSEQLEIEFKSMLAKEHFDRIAAALELTDADFFTQTNVYYDTAELLLRKQKAGLRIRLLSDHAEATLKVPQPIGLLEITDTLPLAAANKLVQQAKFPQSDNIGKQLAKWGIHPNDLQQLATLTTKRADVSLPEGLLALDESWYAQIHDFELELEVTDYQQGQKDFDKLLQQWQIPYIPAKNKIVRAIQAQPRIIKKT